MSAPTPPPSPQPSGAPQAGSGFNMNAWNIFDKIALGAGALFFIFSFISSFYSVSVDGFGSSGVSAWHSWGWLGVLLVLAAVAVVALKAFDGVLPPTLPTPLIAAGASGLGWVLLIIRDFTYPGTPSNCGSLCSGVSAGVGWSGWLLFIIGLVIIAATVIPLTSAAGSVEAKLNDATGKFGGSSN